MSAADDELHERHVRYALISDIHGNLPALEATLADIQRRPDLNATYHLGDLVGYGPWPNEVVDSIRRLAIPGVAGNYDSTVATHYRNCGCRYENPLQEQLSHRSYEWTLEHVSWATTTFLRGLPFRTDVKPLGGHLSGPRLVLVHAHSSNNLIYVEEDRADSFLSKMAAAARLAPGDVIAFGHTHRPWHRELDGVHFVNAGSVGRPKDGDWRACYAVVGIGAGQVEVEFRRVEYDVSAAADAIIASTLPDEFAGFLRTGGKVAAPADA